MVKITSQLRFLILPAIATFVFICLGGNSFSSNPSVTSLDQLRAELKEEIYQEVKTELLKEFSQGKIELMVKEEVRKEMERLAKENSTSPLAALATSQEKESLDQAIRREVRQVLSRNLHRSKVGDAQLDAYFAGQGIEANTQIERGINKSPSTEYMQLAQNSSQHTTMSSEEDGDVTGGAKPERAESIERTLQQKGSILLPKGTLQLEPSTTYAHFSSNRINIQGFSILPVLVIGDIDTVEVKRDVFIETLSLKYGLLNNFQTEIKVPYRAEYDRITPGSASETTRSANGLGDVEIGFSRQIGWEDGLMPDLVAAFNAKSATGLEPYNNEIAMGTGHYAVRGSLIAAKSSDPAVIFGSLSYAYNFAREDIENFGDVKPGDSIGYSLGTAIALSYQVALNFSFDHSFTSKMVRNERNVPDSLLNVANFKTGLNWSIDERKSLDFSVSMGLTTDAPDFVTEIRFPITF